MTPEGECDIHGMYLASKACPACRQERWEAECDRLRAEVERWQQASANADHELDLKVHEINKLTLEVERLRNILRDEAAPCPKCGAGVIVGCYGCRLRQAERERDEAHGAVILATLDKQQAEARAEGLRAALERIAVGKTAEDSAAGIAMEAALCAARLCGLARAALSEGKK